MKSIVAITAVVATLGIATMSLVWGGNEYRVNNNAASERATATTAESIYKEECSSCHMLYPAGLLPERSWRKIMTGLEDHFGDNAELDAETFQQINAYLVKNSADHTRYRRSHKFSRSIKPNDVPLRITEIAYFKHKHDEIPSRLVEGNNKVKSLSQCQACHSEAEAGRFDEDDVRIPGFGNWDD